ncbi:unnamed protein product [Schistocephalus solidus]|uniref:Reverse transcriptase domain-containing protein n=1 Tax=Schistocephalus solidus TaxID=70667 RepID=A0A183SAK9_SCHSO|nr:unnamed protein product [Schistocephalus solidus]
MIQSRDSGFAIYTVYFDFTKAFDRVDHDLLLLKLTSFFDFTKAFDRVDHDLLLLKLTSFGIGNKLLNQISSYFNARAQRVKISDVISKPHAREEWSYSG